jgi:hypothetical protein
MLKMQVFHDSGRMRDSGHMPDFSRKTWLRLYARLHPEGATLVVSPNPVRRRDSGRMSDSDQKIWLRLKGVTPVVCSTLVRICDFGRMPDNGWKVRLWSYAWLQSEDATPVKRHDSCRKTWLRSYARLRSEDETPVLCSIPVGRYDSSCIFWLQSHFLTPVTLPDSGRCHDSDHASLLRSKSVLHVLPTHLWKTMHDRVRWLQHLTTQTLSRK